MQFHRFLPVLLLSTFFLACGSARPLMPVPPSLESTATLQVSRQGWGHSPTPLKFGAWQVTDFRNDKLPNETKASIGSDDLSYSRSKGVAAYRFVMNGWNCRCTYDRRQQDLGLGAPDEALEVELTFVESLDCDIQRAGDEEVWTLHAGGSLAIGGTGYSGTLTNGARALLLRPSHHVAKMRLPGPPVGYLFTSEGEEIASAELLPPGFVRIGQAAGEERDLIATAAAALLLQPSAH